MKKNVSNPKQLYRCFEKKEYMDQFLRGFIRFGNLEEYRKIEDEKRKDIDEGEARVKYKSDKLEYIKYSNDTGREVERGFKTGVINHTQTSINKFFIASLFDERACLKTLSKKYGKYVIRFNDIEKFLELLNKKCTFPWSLGKIKLYQVKYDKDNYITKEENDPHLPPEYVFTQKFAAVSYEYEWRIVIVGSAIEKGYKKHEIIEVGPLEELVSIVDL